MPPKAHTQSFKQWEAPGAEKGTQKAQTACMVQGIFEKGPKKIYGRTRGGGVFSYALATYGGVAIWL